MAKPEDAPAEYIQVVVRRGHGEEEGHHGGVWKIAYADFMTAMMAFFLVMWLVNAANTEMKASVASYFNPIKLSDTVIRKKGLMDVDGKANAEESKKGRTHTPGKSETTPDAVPLRPGEAVKFGTEQGYGRSVEPSELPYGHDGNADDSSRASETGRAFRDPFNPFAPGQLMTKEGQDSESAPGTRPARPVAESEARRAVEAGKQDQGPERRPAEVGKDREKQMAMQSPPAAGETREARPADAGRFAPTPGGEASTKGVAEALKAAEEARKLEASAASVLRDIQTAVKPIAGEGGPGIEVTIEGNGIVLSLTDTSTFGMFAIGSAEPSKQTLDLISRITPVLAANSKRIVVRGHTDSRVYRTQSNNNWRLSMSRAEAAYAMLVRAGIDESRFSRIEGYADRKLKVPTDPEAAANRRIEILLQQVDE
jgi:chemotaxis protein MotB